MLNCGFSLTNIFSAQEYWHMYTLVDAVWSWAPLPYHTLRKNIRKNLILYFMNCSRAQKTQWPMTDFDFSMSFRECLAKTVSSTTCKLFLPEIADDLDCVV